MDRSRAFRCRYSSSVSELARKVRERCRPLPERWHANPHVTSVVTYVDQVSEFGMSGYLSDLGGFGGLHIEVVDCHGVVRWSLDHPILDQPVDVLFTRALEFAEDLERERAAGACWDGIASAN